MAIVDVDVPVDIVSDVGVDSASGVIAVDDGVADVDVGWIDDVVVFAAAGAADKSTRDGSIAKAFVPAEDEGIVVIETIYQMILLGEWMRATRKMIKRYQRSSANGDNGCNITTGT